jgi:hypothetical protein
MAAALGDNVGAKQCRTCTRIIVLLHDPPIMGRKPVWRAFEEIAPLEFATPVDTLGEEHATIPNLSWGRRVSAVHLAHGQTNINLLIPHVC